MLSNKFIGKCNLLNSTICQALFNMGIIWKFQMIHCIIKNVYANKLFKIGIIYHYYILCFFFGSSAQLRLITSRITSRVSSRIWRGAIWHIRHLRADSEVWLSHTSSVGPWSGAPKLRLYDTFLGGLLQCWRTVPRLYQWWRKGTFI